MQLKGKNSPVKEFVLRLLTHFMSLALVLAGETATPVTSSVTAAGSQWCCVLSEEVLVHPPARHPHRQLSKHSSLHPQQPWISLAAVPSLCSLACSPSLRWGDIIFLVASLPFLCVLSRNINV